MENNDRKEFIGGSDIGAVLGISPWKTPLQLWMEKVGEVEPADLSDNEAVEMGTELEETVARMFTKRTGKAVRRAPGYYTHKEYPFMRCQVDRLVTGTDELLECKTASLWKEKDWSGEEIPATYIAQVQWQMMITGRPTGWIAVLIGGQKFVWKELKADKEFHEMMVEKAKQFWQMVQDRVAPMAILGDDDALLALHPKNNDQMALVEYMNEAIAQRQSLSGQIEAMKAEKELLEVKIKECIGDNLGIKTSMYTATWKEQGRKSIDADALKLDGLYDVYSRETKTRVLRIAAAKEKK